VGLGDADGFGETVGDAEATGFPFASVGTGSLVTATVGETEGIGIGTVVTATGGTDTLGVGVGVGVGDGGGVSTTISLVGSTVGVDSTVG
jgi:hypothetical protein